MNYLTHAAASQHQADLRKSAQLTRRMRMHTCLGTTAF
jgi:hypothetical protein